MDNAKDKRLLEQYQLGNSAKKAMYYLEDWIDKKRDKLTRELLAASDAEAAIPIWTKLKTLEEMYKDINIDIQTGELALREMEEENI
jgi:hypothetical protein